VLAGLHVWYTSAGPCNILQVHGIVRIGIMAQRHLSESDGEMRTTSAGQGIKVLARAYVPQLSSVNKLLSHLQARVSVVCLPPRRLPDAKIATHALVANI
jgi:hypothetical protein